MYFVSNSKGFQLQDLICKAQRKQQSSAAGYVAFTLDAHNIVHLYLVTSHQVQSAAVYQTQLYTCDTLEITE